MRRPRPNNGQRRAKPVSDAAGRGVREPRVGGRVMSVRSRRERRNRAGLSFGNSNPIIVREDEIGAEPFERILADPMLRCEMHD
jgi:hypothetical protein